MLRSARTVPEGSTLRGDLCIVGAGAAGLTLARSLAGSRQRVILLESGGLQPDRLTQSLYTGRIEGTGQAPLHASRLRFFGGTTNHWNGICAPFDAIDFKRRSWVPDSGWPIARDSLDRYYRKAQEICELGPYDYGEGAWGRFARTPGAFEEAGAEVALTQHSPPTRFGERYRSDVEESENIQALLHANALRLVPAENAQGVEEVEVTTLEGRRFSVAARRFVLACGAVENARLLLLSNGARPEGLGNAHDLVGRYFLDHPRLRPAGAVLWTDTEMRRFAEAIVQNEVKATLAVRFGEAVQERERMLQTGFFTSAWHGLAQAQGLDDRDGAIVKWLQKLAGDDDPATLSVCWLRAEQSPRRESRVRLGRETDALGQRRVVLEWRLGELDRYTHERAVRLYAELFTRAGAGRVRLAPEVLETPDDPWQRVTSDWHQMGTTRMAASPREGVVDGDCRVFGVENLYLAGASVFPTGGWMNPTLTLVALALRLADHLRDVG
jgi:choline dehydrogenase-like flavoprotein